MKPTYPCKIIAVLMGVISTAIAGGASLLSSAQAQDTAQTWPSKPIHAIVPFTAGTATDIVARAVFEPLSAELGQGADAGME
jgi:tripartite-type tricarboxylate transporter receptor subunit TctC